MYIISKIRYPRFNISNNIIFIYWINKYAIIKIYTHFEYTFSIFVNRNEIIIFERKC